MSHDYYKPFYMPSVESIFPFQDEFRDANTEFFKVKYRIKRGQFVPRIKGGTHPALGNIYDYRGKEIFQPLFNRKQINRSDYLLLKEERESLPFYDEITETYGFVPNLVYSKFSNVSVQFAGHTERGNGTAIAEIMPILDSTGTTISFPYLYKGDEAYFIRPYKAIGAGSVNKLTSSIFVLDADGEAPNPSWANDDGGTVSTRSVISAGVVPSLYLHKRTTAPRTQTVSVKTQSQFFYNMPDIIPHTSLVDSLGNEVWDATDATITNLYNNLYCIEDSEIFEDNTIGLWRRDIKLTRWKVF